MKTNQLHVDLSNPFFSSLIKRYKRMIEECFDSLKLHNVDQAKIKYSEEFEKYFFNIRNLDQIPYSELLVGTFSSEFADMFKKMLLLWKDIQQDLLNLPEPDIVTEEKFRLRLRLIDKKLEALILNLEPSNK